MKFSVTSEGANSLGLREACERHVNELWIPIHPPPPSFGPIETMMPVIKSVSQCDSIGGVFFNELAV